MILRFLNRFDNFPSIVILRKIKSIYLRKIWIRFWNFLFKKDKQIKKIFYTKDNNSFTKINFDYSKFFENEESIFKSLSSNGLIVFENVLGETDYKLVKDIFYKIEKNENDSRDWDTAPYVFKENNPTKSRIIAKYDLKKIPDLNLLSNRITKHLFSKELEATADFFYDKALSIPEKKVRGDNLMHVDRFIPNVKILYFPFEITMNDAPFTYALGSHKIDENYINFLANSYYFDETEKGSENFLKNVLPVKVLENSAIVALTNGFHGRRSFESLSKRCTIFLQYAKHFKKSKIFKRYLFK